MNHTKSCLIVEDEHLTADALNMLLDTIGVRVDGIAHNGTDAVRMALELQPDIVFMDVRLGPGPDGVDASMAIKEKIDPRIVFITASMELETLDRIEADHAFRVLFKPYSVDQLREAIAAA